MSLNIRSSRLAETVKRA